LNLAESMDGGIYNGHNCPINTDFAHILDWIMDKLLLANIPAHYLIPDPSYLPEETLRFFHVDWNWTDAMIDGALSLANHWANTPDTDDCRKAIKDALNRYIFAKDPTLKYRPQMPQYGFLLRSSLLVKFPDLTVSATFAPKPAWAPDNAGAPILIQRKLAEDTLLCLFDSAHPELTTLAFTMPPHQQFFTLGQSLQPRSLEVQFKRIYTSGNDKPEDRRRGLGKEIFQRDGETDENRLVFDWASRTMNVHRYASFVYKRLKDKLKDDFGDTEATSAMLGVQLNEPIYILQVPTPPSLLDTPVKERIFQLSTTTSANAKVQPPPLQPYECKAKSLPVRLVRPPHFRHEPTPLTIQLPDPDLDPTIIPSDPRFWFNVFTLPNPGYIPTQEGVPIDLVFSIRFRDGSMSKPLERIRIQVPCGEVNSQVPSPRIPKDDAKPDKTKPLINVDAAPQMPTMITNLRFNVIKSWSSDRKHLILDLWPRSASGIRLDRIREASFLLGLVDICPWGLNEKGLPQEAYVSCKHTYVNLQKVVFDNGKMIQMKPRE